MVMEMEKVVTWGREWCQLRRVLIEEIEKGGFRVIRNIYIMMGEGFAWMNIFLKTE